MEEATAFSPFRPATRRRPPPPAAAARSRCQRLLQHAAPACRSGAQQGAARLSAVWTCGSGWDRATDRKRPWRRGLRPAARRRPPLARGDGRGPSAQRLPAAAAARSKALCGIARPGQADQDGLGWCLRGSAGRRPRQGRFPESWGGGYFTDVNFREEKLYYPKRNAPGRDRRRRWTQNG